MQEEIESITSEIPVNGSRKKNLTIVLLLVFLLTVPTIPYLLYRYGINSNPQTNKEITVEIKQGDGVSQIANRLVDAGLINSATLFKIFVKLNGVETNLQAGVYTIPPKTTMVALVDIIQYGRNDITVRYIEGWRVEQLGMLLLEKLDNFDYQTFVVEARKLEGQLFPDTYFMNREATVKDVIDLLQDTFNEKTVDLLSPESLNEVNLTKKEAIILASIVEREAVDETDRKIIAGILIKRLGEGMRLEADATTQYAVALKKHCAQHFADSPDCLGGTDSKYLEEVTWWPYDLTEEDLDDDSPYNTRKNYGLPPTPISSFGVSALEAVVNFEPSDYYFYLTDPGGKTHYAITLDQHNTNTFKYLN